MKKGTVVRCIGVGCRPGYAEALAVRISAGIAHPERTAALETRLENANSALSDRYGCWKSTHTGSSASRVEDPEYQICLEANVFSKNSRVIDALRSQLTEACT